MPKPGVGPVRRRQGTNNGWRSPAKTASRDRTRTPSSTSVAGFYQGITPPTPVGNMADRWEDQSKGPPEDLDPACGVRPAKGTKVREMAGRLWTTSFAHEHDEELKSYMLSGLLDFASQLLLGTPASSWQRQNRSGENARARRKDKGLPIVADAVVRRVNAPVTPQVLQTASIERTGRQECVQTKQMLRGGVPLVSYRSFCMWWTPRTIVVVSYRRFRLDGFKPPRGRSSSQISLSKST